MNNTLKAVQSRHSTLGIPYMGSKRKLASKIVDYMLDNNPDCKYVYDLFGGGGAISFEAIDQCQKWGLI